MADKPSDKTDLLPWADPQNPSPVGFDSQNKKDCRRDQVDRILEVFQQLLPSNYVSQVQGPWYSMQFQAMAEQIAKIQCVAQEAFADSFWEYTRPEFLYQILGLLVFPDALTDGIPTIRGDLSYRDFMREMVKLILEGATKDNVQSGLELLTDATVEIIERGVEARQDPNSAWGDDDLFTFEINMEGVPREITRAAVGLPGDGTVELGRFPDDSTILQENVFHVLKALKPAHTLYDMRFLFRDAFGDVFSDEMSCNSSSYYYEDFRRYCLGRKHLTSGVGGTGETLSDRSLFSDPSRDFSSILPGAELVVLTGPNSTTASTADEGWVGHYRVMDILVFPVGDDATPRAYTTSPSSLTGFATVSGDEITDASQDWASAVEGEQFTFTEGPNAGTYRLKTLVGSDGGPVGHAPGPATIVKAAPSLLRIRYFMPHTATGQEYTVVVDRMGVQTPYIVTGEDASVYFTP
jgi:hypothetical protein